MTCHEARSLLPEKEMLQISVPAKSQDFLFEKLSALGTLESISPMNQQPADKPDDSSIVTLKLVIGASSGTSPGVPPTVPQQK
jgi:hypothetical protein